LKAGVEVCRRFGAADNTRRMAHALLAEFVDVASYPFTAVELEALKPDRQIARFGPLLNLAKRLVRGCVPDRPGAAPTFSLLFDMNSVFEQYIGKLLRRVCPPPFRVQLQATGRSLVSREGRRKFLLRPDIAVR